MKYKIIELKNLNLSELYKEFCKKKEENGKRNQEEFPDNFAKFMCNNL